MIYGASDEDDWTSEATWYKANPSLGETIDIEKVRNAYISARENAAEENIFRQLRLNQWVKQSTRWMQMDKWDVCAFLVNEEELIGRTCYGGLDLSSTLDITAFVLVFPPRNDEEKYIILPYCWIPEDNMRLRVRRDHVPYDVWTAEGCLETTEGNVIHYGFIEKFIEELGTKYHIKEIAFDRWGATQMVQDLEGMGFTVVPFGQGYKDMSPPTKELMKLTLEERSAHGGHKVLRWMMDNVYVRQSYVLDADKEGNSNLVKAEFYQLAAKHYANIGEREKVYHLKVKIKNAFKDAGSSGEFKTISTTQSVSVEQLEKETKDFFKESIEDTFATVSHSSDFIINKEKIVLQATEQAKNPLYKLVDFGHIEGNRKVFSTQDDDDVIKHLTFQNYGIELEVTFSTVVNFIWTKMIDMGLTAQMVISRICETEYMDETQKEIIAVGIDRFFEDDYVSALHVLVPQFESYFRTFFEWGGFPTTSLKNNGLQHEQNFNDFLRQDFVRESLDENLLFMIEFVMVEQLGKNLRNNIAHRGPVRSCENLSGTGSSKRP